MRIFDENRRIVNRTFSTYYYSQQMSNYMAIKLSSDFDQLNTKFHNTAITITRFIFGNHIYIYRIPNNINIFCAKKPPTKTATLKHAI